MLSKPVTPANVAVGIPMEPNMVGQPFAIKQANMASIGEKPRAYSILAGIGIGLLDALPIFGTGTVLIPWAIGACLRGKWLRGLVIFGLYVICYFVRQILEAKLMGDKVGLSPLETLISMYVGLQLFGILGVLLGPVGVLVVKEFAGEP